MMAIISSAVHDDGQRPTAMSGSFITSDVDLMTRVTMIMSVDNTLCSVGTSIGTFIKIWYAHMRYRSDYCFSKHLVVKRNHSSIGMISMMLDGVIHVY